MRLYQFVEKYKGKKVDFDGKYGAQCVDLFRQYAKEVWETPPTEGVEGAKDLYLNYDKMPKHKKYYQKINKNEIKSGDVVIFDATPTNKFGHVAICLYKESSVVGVFEQDGFRQDGAKETTYSLKNALGGLRKAED